MDELSGEELVARSGVTARRLRRLVELGTITPTPQGRYRRSDIQRIRVVDALADAGFAPEQLAELIAAGAYDLDWASVVFPEPTAQMATTLEQTAAATGLREGLVARLFDAWELPRPQPGQALRADDQELLHLAVPVLEGGVAGDRRHGTPAQDAVSWGTSWLLVVADGSGGRWPLPGPWRSLTGSGGRPATRRSAPAAASRPGAAAQHRWGRPRGCYVCQVAWVISTVGWS